MTPRAMNGPDKTGAKALGIEICKHIHRYLKAVSSNLAKASTDDAIISTIKASKKWISPPKETHDVWPDAYMTLEHGLIGLHLLATHGRIPKAIASTYEKPACAISRCMVGAPPLNSRDESEQKALQFAFRLYAEQMRATGGKTPKGALPGTRKVDLATRRNELALGLALIALRRWTALQIKSASLHGYAAFLSKEVRIHDFVETLNPNDRGTVADKARYLTDDERKARKQEQVRNWLKTNKIRLPPERQTQLELERDLMPEGDAMANHRIILETGFQKRLQEFDAVKTIGGLATKLRSLLKSVNELNFPDW